MFYLQGPSVGRRGGEGKKVVGVRIVGAGMRKGGDLIPVGSCQELWSHRGHREEEPGGQVSELPCFAGGLLGTRSGFDGQPLGLRMFRKEAFTAFPSSPKLLNQGDLGFGVSGAKSCHHDLALERRVGL